MGRCPKCGTIVPYIIKKFEMVSRPDKYGRHLRVEIGIFYCPNCGKRFKEVLGERKV